MMKRTMAAMFLALTCAHCAGAEDATDEEQDQEPAVVVVDSVSPQGKKKDGGAAQQDYLIVKLEEVLVTSYGP